MKTYIATAKLTDDNTREFIADIPDFIVRAENDDDAQMLAEVIADQRLDQYNDNGDTPEVTTEEVDTVQAWIFNGRAVRFNDAGQIIEG